jgi:hypothetical protein
MARNGSGTYNLISGNPVVTGTTISSTWANNTLNDIATALSGSIASDGQTPITANLPMAGYKLTNVGAGSLLTDYARIDQLQNSSVTWLTGVTGTDTITASLTITPSAYAAGQVFRFISAGANTTTSATLNINSLGAKTITKKGDANINIGDLPANAIITVVYDGIKFQIIGIETRQFRIYATATPSMSLIIDAGNIQQQTTLTSIAKQTTTAFVSPVTNPRNDLIVLDETTGAYSIVAGTEAASPADPAIPANKILLARVRLTVGMTSINSTNFDDLLPLYYANGITQSAADLRYAALAGLATQVFNSAPATSATNVFRADQSFISAAPFGAPGYIKVPLWESVGGTIVPTYIQWAIGTATAGLAPGANVSQTLTWPVAFPNACAFALCNQYSGSPTLLVHQLISAGQTNCVVNIANPSQTVYNAIPIAIGIGY